MKRVITLFLLMPFTVLGQDTLTYEQLSKTERMKEVRGQYDVYKSKTGFCYSVEDTLTIGSPSGSNGNFVHIKKYDIMGTEYPVKAGASNTNAIIKKIKASGNRRSGFKAHFQTKGASAVDNYFFNLEDAIEAGEIDGKGMTSDEALEELKKWKDKLDLELISEEEYNEKKEELSKYIK